MADIAHHAADLADRVDGLRGRALDRADLVGDLFGRLRGLARERLHFGRHHRKAPAGFARARGLDRGVEREQVGLLRDGADQLDDVADAARARGELADQRVGVLRDVGWPCGRRCSPASPAG